MRVERPQDRWFWGLLSALALVVTTGLGAGLRGAAGAREGAALGVGVASLIWTLSRRKSARRRALLAEPFPEPWRAVLEARYDHYARLSRGLRERFENDVRLFIAEKRITGVEVEVTDELRVLVAASAVTLSLGWPGYEWDRLAEVLLYPDSFDRDYRFGVKELAGQAHPWGTVILSVPSLQQSFAHPDDAYHVGLHEFAHLLDVETSRFDGIPEGLDTAHRRDWAELVLKEMERLRKGKSALDPYGSKEPAEFLAVAVEAFFEIPQELRQRHRELYAMLSDFFRQDPATWDDTRFGDD